MKLKIHVKLLLFILSAALVTYIASLVYINMRAGKANSVAVGKNQKGYITNSALVIGNMIESAVCSLRSYAASVCGSEQLTEEQRQELYRSGAALFLESNQIFSNLRISWELKSIDNAWMKNFGRRVYFYTRGDGNVKENISNLNLDGDDFNSRYYKIKVSGRESITDVYNENPSNPNAYPVFKTTISIPVNSSDGNFAALVSADIEISNYVQAVKNSLSYETFANMLINDYNQVLGLSINGSSSEVSDISKIVVDSLFEISAKIDSAGYAFMNVTDSTGRKLILSGVHINNNIFQKPWVFVSTIPEDVVNAQKISQTKLSIFIVMVGLFVIAIVIIGFSKNITEFLQSTGNILKQLSLGNFTHVPDIDQKSSKELETIAVSVNNLKAGLSKAVIFAEEIGKGNLDTDFTPLSKNDELGLSLLGMRESLKSANEEESKRKDLDSKQNWATEGAAKFGEILRQYNNNMSDFSFNIISNLVKYIGANQGGLFVLNNDNKDKIFFELTAGYAYNIRKILQKRVEPGVGLVGRCILESESIYINNLPDDYINITSGLGEKSPKCLLIVPFKFNNEIYAVAEIASFTEIEPYKQEFVEQVGNSIASTIATVKINVRTNKLVEELKVQSEELASQEEEMRQNMEEMKATQEEMARKADEYEQTYVAMSQVLILIEYDVNGKMVNLNNNAMEFLCKSKASLVDRQEPLYEVIYESEKTESSDFWLQVRVGRTKVVSKIVKINNKIFTIEETYNPVQNYYGKIYKVMCIIVDVTKYQSETQEIF